MCVLCSAVYTLTILCQIFMNHHRVATTTTLCLQFIIVRRRVHTTSTLHRYIKYMLKFLNCKILESSHGFATCFPLSCSFSTTTAAAAAAVAVVGIGIAVVAIATVFLFFSSDSFFSLQLRKFEIKRTRMQSRHLNVTPASKIHRLLSSRIV